jgi:hypothetical protein
MQFASGKEVPKNFFGQERVKLLYNLSHMTVTESHSNLSLKYRYLILSLVVFLFGFINVLFGGWSPLVDIWDHAAVIRELATHPFSPVHPRILANLPHAFFSPYDLALALIVRVTGIQPLTILSIFSLINILLFLLCLNLFVDSIFTSGTAFYSLLFILFLWGLHPWLYSSFYHFNAFLRTSSYPSFFCLNLTFLSFYIYITIIKANRNLLFIPLALIAGVVLITHPTTAIFLYIGLLSISICHYNYTNYNYLSFIVTIIILSFGFAFIWPYFSFIDLIKTSGSEFSLDSKTLYDAVLIKIFPVLIGVIIIIKRLKKNIYDLLGLMFFGLCFIYIYGGISYNYTYGRLISFIVLVLQIAIADWVANNESIYLSRQYDILSKKKIYQFALCGFSLIIILKLAMQLRSYITTYQYYHSYKDLAFISKYTEQYGVILSDIQTSWVIPTFGGKVVAGLHAQAFISDHFQRKADLRRFFSKDATNKERLDIIHKYHAGYILLRNRPIGMNKKPSKLDPEVINFCYLLGTVLYSQNGFILIKIN